MVFQSKGSNTGDMRVLARYFPRNSVPQTNLTNIISKSAVSLVLKHHSLFDERDYILRVGFNKIFEAVSTKHLEKTS